MTHGDLSSLSQPAAGNELVVDGRGNAYLNGGGFDLMAGEPFAPGIIALVTPQGTARQVADGIAVPNGMLVTPDNATLIVAESYGSKLTASDVEDDGSLPGRHVWAGLGDGVPDGICLDAENAAWYGDVPNKRCVRVREGGEVLQTIELDRGCAACALGGPRRRTLFMTATRWDGPENMFARPRTADHGHWCSDGTDGQLICETVSSSEPEVLRQGRDDRPLGLLPVFCRCNCLAFLLALPSG